MLRGSACFAALFELVGEIGTEVHRWGATEDGVLIEFTVTGKAGDNFVRGRLRR